MAEDQPPVSEPATSAAGGDPEGLNPQSGPGDAAAAPDGGEAASLDGAFDQAAIDEILKQASFEDVSDAVPGVSAPSAGASAAAAAGMAEAMAGVAAEPIATEDFQLPSFQQAIADAAVSSIDLLRDVDLNVKIELGRSRMLVEDVLKLGEGSVVELDKLAGDPVDVFVNERLVARGEVLVLNDNFCVRINEIVAGNREEAI